MRIVTLAVLLLLFFSCGSHEYKKAEDPQDAGRQFIRASLDGDYDKATFYMLKDTTNTSFLKKWKDDYDKLSSEEKHSYKEAEIWPVTIKPLPDSTFEYTYTNSYKAKDTTVINIVKLKAEWLVDLKHIH